MITAQGQIQRIAVSDIRILGRNTQGVRIMTLDADDTLVAIKRIPKDENSAKELGVGSAELEVGSAELDTPENAASEPDKTLPDTSEHDA